MTTPPHALIQAGVSVLAGADVCAAAGFRLRPRGRAATFDDDIWNFGDIEGLSVQMSGPACTRLDFTAISDPRWRLAAKEYLFARLAPGHPEVAVLPNAFRVPLTLSSCLKRLAETTRWMNWLAAQRVPSLGDATQDHCDRYLAERRLRRDAAGTAIGPLEASAARVAAAVIIELASYGQLLSADRYRDGFTPWNGRSSSQVAGMRPPAENKTPVVGQELLQPLLAAALYMTSTIAPHLVTLPPQVQQRRREDAQLSEAAADPGRGSGPGRRCPDPPAPGVETWRPAPESQLHRAGPRGRNRQDPPGATRRSPAADRADPRTRRHRQAVGPPGRARAPAPTAREPRPGRSRWTSATSATSPATRTPHASCWPPP